jgi:hypothetical protein
MSNFTSKSILTLSTAPCRAFALSASCLRVIINLEVK